MVMVDNERRLVAANAAARLFFRLSLTELRALRLDDLTPPHELGEPRRWWERLMNDGAVAGFYNVGFPDRSVARISYCALSNMLPGQHLIVFMPAHWPDDELGAADHEEATASVIQLSRREREVLTLVAAGANTLEIATELVISPATVRTHLENAFRKLGARNRPHAIALAMRLGLIESGPLASKDRDRSAA
jgi:DNA-binding CsgD family transcriptional regulator